ncbi:hypothetical protein GUJ93_ZPchr0008g13300 [Zizania palustris]|uniref:Uncharacterized protein n=1 Tax=Zizania palustris TaxID=103762 RepID=A0A8J5RXK9_ZIZPA|nr:hypothetical protein GUJ93_ZPchr0008g13300 [Zizania palustris]
MSHAPTRHACPPPSIPAVHPTPRSPHESNRHRLAPETSSLLLIAITFQPPLPPSRAAVGSETLVLPTLTKP